MVVEPGAVVGELVVGQDAGGGLAVFLAGPLVVGAVQPGRVGVAAAVRRGRSGSSGRRGCRAGRSRRRRGGGELGGDGGGLGLLGRGGRHVLIVAAGVPHLAHCIKYKCCMDANAEVAAYIGRWRPSSVSPQAAAFARDVIAQAGPQGRERAKNLLWAAGKLADYAHRAGPGPGAGGAAAPVGRRAVHPVRAGPVAAWRGARCARTCGSSAAGWCRSCIRRICRCPGSGPRSPTARRRSAGSSRWRTPSPRAERRMRAAGLVCLGAGAGLIRGDLRDVRGSDVACRSGGVVVTVRGARPRAVPVLARYHARLLAAARSAGNALICGGTDPGRRNITNPLISALDGGSGPAPAGHLPAARDLAGRGRGAARAGHVHARGRDQLLPAARRPGRRAGAGRRGRGGPAARGGRPAMIPLAAFEEIIDASGVAPRIEAMLPVGRAAPAAAASAPCWPGCAWPRPITGPPT